jgi:hypothetical protein
MERIGHKIRNLLNIRHGVGGNLLSLFFLYADPAVNNGEIYHIEYLQNMRVQIEPPHQKQNNTPQCKRCTHQGNCAHRQRCVKCSKSHSTKQYTLLKTQPKTCLHFGGSHPATYRGCKVYQTIIRIRFSSPRIIASIHITNAPGQEKKCLRHHRKLKVDRK